MIQVALIYFKTLLLSLTFNIGMSTQFSAIDPYNPNPHLACVRNTSLVDTMPVVAHRTFQCGSKVVVCKLDLTKCTVAIVADRLGNHCKVKKGRKCIKYWSDIDLSKAVGKAINHNGFEPVLYINMVGDECQRKQNLESLKRRKKYIRQNS